jgi:endoglucanase
MKIHFPTGRLVLCAVTCTLLVPACSMIPPGSGGGGDPAPATTTSAAATTTTAPTTSGDPRVRVSASDHNILTIQITDGTYVPTKQEPYVPQPGDWINRYPHGETIIDPDEAIVELFRDGQQIGHLVGPDESVLTRFSSVTGSLTDTSWMDDLSGFVVNGAAPTKVTHVQKPGRLAVQAGWKFQAVLEHTVHLTLPFDLDEGTSYVVDLPGTDELPSIAYTHDPVRTRSDVVHVNQVGFRPDDPSKRAFLSLWSGAAHSYPDGLGFSVNDALTGDAVFTGRAILGNAADAAAVSAPWENEDGTNVYELDFSTLGRPGRYVVTVDGIGSSYEFPISDTAWDDAAAVALRGFAHQRSGIELGAPWTDYSRPADFTADRVTVYTSTTSLMESGNGLCTARPDGACANNFDELVAGLTAETIPVSAGGYHDAGDFDRRIQHLWATRQLLELVELFPDAFTSDTTSIPESGNGLPDILDEARWNLDFYRSMQTADGGIRGGIESSEHPKGGEASWQESLTVIAYAPDMWSSYIYAGVAARFAVLTGEIDAQTSDQYLTSALKAMQFAEERYVGTTNPRNDVRDERNLAALELYRATGDARWHDMFLADSVYTDPTVALTQWSEVIDNNGWDQSDAAFLYPRLDPANYPLVDAARQSAMRDIYRAQADEMLRLSDGTGFKTTKPTQWNPSGYGTHGPSRGAWLVRAHVLTGDEVYLAGALDVSLYGAGANPMNLVMTSGVGANPVRYPYVLDDEVTPQSNGSAKPGITVYGAIDFGTMNAGEQFRPFVKPGLDAWPISASYFDAFWDYRLSEFTVMETMGPVAYVWGYLAARA